MCAASPAANGCLLSQMQDASFAAYLIKPRVGQEVQFDVEEAAHGPRAINVRRILPRD